MNSSFFLRKPLGKYNPFWRVFLDIIEFVKYDILLAHWNSFSLLSNNFVQKERTLLITPWTKVCHPGSELQRPRCLLHYLHTEICPASFQTQTWLKTPFPPWCSCLFYSEKGWVLAEHLFTSLPTLTHAPSLKRR